VTGKRSARALVVAAASVVLLGVLIASPEAAAAVPDLSVSNGVSDATPNVGDTVIFTVTVADGVAATATGVTVQDSLPSGLRFVAATPSQGSYNSLSGTWTVGTLAAGTSATLQIQAQVASPVSQTDIATLGESDPTPGDNTASATETPQQADLDVLQAVDNSAPNPGDTVTLAITLLDNGPDPATNVTLHDALPAGLTFISATPPQGTYVSTTGVWTVGTVSVGSSLTLLLRATYHGPGRLINTSSVSHADQFDPNPNNNSSSRTVGRTATQTVLSSSADPSLSSQQVRFTATVAPAPDGGTVTFTVDGTQIGSPVAVDNITGSATSSAVSTLAVGSHQVVATYSGDSNFAGSKSTALAETVNSPPSGAGGAPAGGGTTGPSGPSGPNGPAGPTTPLISHLALSPAAFTAASSGPSAHATARHPAGATVTYTLNQAASVRFTVAHLVPGRTGTSGRCVNVTKRNRHAHPCKRVVTLSGGFTLAGLSGPNVFRFTGRLAGHGLPVGSYELIATPSIGGRAGSPVHASFRILPASIRGR
jgi:uncharacterized repeat protein (TIGR01451 family)